jgi:ParB family transcriptional regulator, chromosome partitioning protein
MELSEKRRALGRGLGALIPSTPAGESGSRPVDVFFKDNSAARARSTSYDGVSRETTPGSSPRVAPPAPSSPAPDVSRETAPQGGRTDDTDATRADRDGDSPSGAGDVSRETNTESAEEASPGEDVAARADPAQGDVSRETGGDDAVSRDEWSGLPAESGQGGSVVLESRASAPQERDGAGETTEPDVLDAVTPNTVMSDRSDVNTAPGAPTPGVAGSSAEPEQPEGFEGLAPVPGARFAELPVLAIRPNPRQPRTVFDDEDMAELAHSIREIGVLQPVVVRPIPADELDQVDVVESTGERPRFELIMGERRWRATQEAGLDTIPAIIKETHDDDLLRDALLENLHRSQLNALEEAAAYQQLLDDFGCTHDQLATRIGRSRPQISNTLRLLKLPPLVQRRVAAGVLSAGHARALLGLADGASMERLAQRIVAEGLSVRTVEEIVTLGSNDAPRPARRPRAGARHPQLDDLAARLSDRFDTRVSIALGQRKGKLTVEFASVDDLNRIVDLLGADGASHQQG